MGQTNDKTNPAGVRKQSGKQAPRFDSSRFVQYELDSDQVLACKNWEVSADDLWRQAIAVVDDGYSITFKYDSWSGAYACFIQVRGNDQHANAGLILTGRGSIPSKAFKQALFKMDAIGPSWIQFGERQQTTLDD